MRTYYGIVKISQIFEIIEKVVYDLKGSKEDAESTIKLMVGTIAQETKLGTFRDPSPYKYGSGLCQIDPGIPFDDVQDRASRYIDKVISLYGIDILSATHRELELSPLLSVVMCRVKYKLIPKAIPSDSEGQWLYYKKYYNSYLGKATREEYIENSTWGMEHYKKWKEKGE